MLAHIMAHTETIAAMNFLVCSLLHNLFCVFLFFYFFYYTQLFSLASCLSQYVLLCASLPIGLYVHVPDPNSGGLG